MFKCAIKEQKLAYFISVCRINWSLARLRFSSFSFSSFLIFLMSYLRLMMFALKFHLPPSQTGILWNKASFVECLAHANGGPWSTPMWLLTSACIERFLSTNFTKLSQIESHIWTQADHLSPCLKNPDYCDEDDDFECWPIWSKWRWKRFTAIMRSDGNSLEKNINSFELCVNHHHHQPQQLWVPSPPPWVHRPIVCAAGLAAWSLSRLRRWWLYDMIGILISSIQGPKTSRFYQHSCIKSPWRS